MSEVAEAFDIDNYEEQFLQCRTFGHSWRVASKNLHPDNDQLVLLDLGCSSCRSHRHDLVSRLSGTVFTRRYKHTDGYLHKKGQGNTTRVAYRLEFVGRTFGKAA